MTLPHADGEALDATEMNTAEGGLIVIEAGENISAGEVVYIHLTDGKAYVADTGTADDIRANGIAETTDTTGNDVTSSPAIADGYVYVGSSDKKIYCLDADDGLEIWNYTTGGAINSGPAVSEESLYVSAADKIHNFQYLNIAQS